MHPLWLLLMSGRIYKRVLEKWNLRRNNSCDSVLWGEEVLFHLQSRKEGIIYELKVDLKYHPDFLPHLDPTFVTFSYPVTKRRQRQRFEVAKCSKWIYLNCFFLPDKMYETTLSLLVSRAGKYWISSFDNFGGGRRIWQKAQTNINTNINKTNIDTNK